jgi:predicted RNA-binding protein YlxR (DUF448 family)
MSATEPQPQASVSGRPAPESEAPPGGRARSCVGCGERVDVALATDLVRLIVSGNGEIAVDARGSGFGRGAHVHARPECLRRAVERGLSRSVKARVHTIQTGLADPAGETAPLSVGALAEAIRRAMDRRIEGMLIAAARAKRVALGSDAVTGASQREEAELVVVAADAAAAADLTAVRRAVAEGRAVAWGSKERLGELLLRAGEGAQLAVLAVRSRSMAGPLRDAVRISDACAAVASGQPIPKGPAPERQRQRSKGTQPNRAVAAESGNSQSAGACAPALEGGKLGAPEGDVAPRGGGARRDRGWHQAGEGAHRTAERAPTEDRSQSRQRTAPRLEQRAAKPGEAQALSRGARRAAGPAHAGRGSVAAVPSRSRRSEG